MSYLRIVVAFNLKIAQISEGTMKMMNANKHVLKNKSKTNATQNVVWTQKIKMRINTHFV